MKDIKTRENKKDIKMLDRAAGLAKVTKDTTVRTKDQIQNLSDDGQITPDEYAEDKVKNTVCFFGYREIYNLFELEEKLEEHIRILLESKEYVEFFVGRNGEFDQLVSSTVRRVKRNYRDDNSALVLVLPYLSAEYTSDKVKQMIERQKEKYGWEFLFIGDNIDAVETAARYGIGKDRAVNYNADSQGTQVLYDTVAQAVCNVRASTPLSSDWGKNITEDFNKRKI